MELGLPPVSFRPPEAVPPVALAPPVAGFPAEPDAPPVLCEPPELEPPPSPASPFALVKLSVEHASAVSPTTNIHPPVFVIVVPSVVPKLRV
jgi:hypothetical protein